MYLKLQIMSIIFVIHFSRKYKCSQETTFGGLTPGEKSGKLKKENFMGHTGTNGRFALRRKKR